MIEFVVHMTVNDIQKIADVLNYIERSDKFEILVYPECVTTRMKNKVTGKYYQRISTDFKVRSKVKDLNLFPPGIEIEGNERFEIGLAIPKEELPWN